MDVVSEKTFLKALRGARISEIREASAFWPSTIKKRERRNPRVLNRSRGDVRRLRPIGSK